MSLSSFVLLYYIFAWHFFPIVSTSIELKPIINNLKLPIESFLNLFMVLCIMVLSFKIYSEKHKCKTLSVVKYKYSESEIWLLGIIGIFAFILSWVFGAKNVNKINTSPLFAITDVAPLMYAPFVLVMSNVVYIKEAKVNRYLLILYAFIFVFLSMISNRRATVASVFLIPIYILMFAIYIKRYDYRKFLKQKYFVLLLLLYPIFSFVSDFGYAILSVRGERGDVEPIEMIDKTIEAMQDEEKLQSIKDRFVSDDEVKVDNNKAWDEYYVNNMFFSRQGNVKYVDLSLIYADKIKGNEILDRYFDFVISLFPQFVIDYCGFKVDKSESVLCSLGDYMLYYGDNNRYALFGKRLGNICGLGWVCFGALFPIVLFLIMFLVYSALDIFVVVENGMFYISLIGALHLQKLISIFAFHEGISSYTGFVFRGMLNYIFLATIMYVIANIYRKLRML